MGKKLSFNFIEDFIESFGFKLISTEYKNNRTKLVIRDKEGYYYSVTLSNLRKYKQTNSLSNKFDIHNPYTIQNIKLWCKLNNKDFKLVSDKYEGNTTYLKWNCLKGECGEEFSATWNQIYANHGCGVCDGRQVSLSNCLATRNPELASEWHPTKNGDLTPHDVTTGSNKDVWWQCLNNLKHEWHARINNRNNSGENCPYCSGRLPSDENNLLINNPKLCEEWDYKKNSKQPEDCMPYSKKEVWWQCKVCGRQWKSSIYNRNKDKCGCPECNESQGERSIRKFLEKYNILYTKEHTFNDLLSDLGNPLRYDFAIFTDDTIKMLIEFDGGQHYTWVKGWQTKDDFIKLQYHDQLKNNYCNKNNIKLIRIPHWDYDKIEKILSMELMGVNYVRF